MDEQLYYSEQETKEIIRQYKELLRVSYQVLSDEDKKLIRLAFDTAVDAHKTQRRKSGEPYIFHPIAVAHIVASKIGLDAISIAAALLHDVIEDTPYTYEDIQRIFGTHIAKIVRGLTKIAHLSKDNDISHQAENFRKLLLTLNDDIRVILIKIADRLHNMQTMDAMPEHKQTKIASETLYIYAPLAHRIGLFNIKTELEDLGLKYTDSEMYYAILNRIKDSKEEQRAYIEAFSKTIEHSLNKRGIEYYIKGRPKSIYSIYKKMMAQNISYDEVFDKFAIRIIYKSSPEDEKLMAWNIYSLVTEHFRPNPTRLRDWISTPKSTGYEALHITVMGPQEKWVEVQIRSERMHEIAEKGYAAHFKYKHGNQQEGGIEVWLNRLQEIFENSEGNAVDFVEEFKLSLYAKEIFVFTPQGQIKSLPKGATPLDFAFSIHSEIGMKTRGARVGGKLVPLNHQLKSGDTVEIIVSDSVRPTKNWLNYATTAKARSKIKSALREEKRIKAEEGKEILIRKLKQLKSNLSEDVINDLVNYFKTKTSLDIYYQVATGEIDNLMLKEFVANRNSIFNFFKKSHKKHTEISESNTTVNSSEYKLIVFGKENEKLDYSFAKCCTPIPSDLIFGFVTVNEGIKVHRKDCPNAISMQSNYAYRILPAHWIKEEDQDFKVVLLISGIDRAGIVKEVSNVILDSSFVRMTNISIDSEGDIFTGKIGITVNNNETLKKLIKSIRAISGVEKVIRSS